MTCAAKGCRRDSDSALSDLLVLPVWDFVETAGEGEADLELDLALCSEHRAVFEEAQTTLVVLTAYWRRGGGSTRAAARSVLGPVAG